ncbi:MAG: hypothetical protein ABSC30_10915 [Acidimicrobiales bacterium]
MTHVLDPALHDGEGVEPLFVTLPVATSPGSTAPKPGDGVRRDSGEGGGSFVIPRTQPGPSFAHRHRVALIVATVIVTVVASAAGIFVYEWNHSGPHQVSFATAYQRFRSGATGALVDPGTLRPHDGVYSYRGSGHEHISLPPKSQVEGPGIPGTVKYQSDGCWVWRLDYSDSHWQNATFCARAGNLVEVARAGWYRWNLVTLSIADTGTYNCSPEIAIPAVLHVGQRFPFSCTGTSSPIKTGVVTMRGTNRYVGPQTLRIGGTDVPTLHFREVSTFTGGQWGTNVSDIWFSTVNGLPVKGTWTTKVSSPTFLGTSTLTGGASFTLKSLTPRS